MAHSRGGRNPIYSWKHFADYRTKVTQKESENEGPTWPLYLEDAFLDALLLIPLMGRKKFSSKGVLYGRNMLITEYLWICHWILYPAAPGEIVPVGKAREKHPMYRQRKQVSSHIQVLKGFFLPHPLFHFFFPRKNDNEKEEDRRHTKEEEEEGEMESFKNNRVLISLADGRLPDERPNYDYFARLLAGDSDVFVRPKTCWIYVCSSEVTLSDDYKKAYATDGTCLEADAYTPDGIRLECKGDYPHLVLNSNKETRRDLARSKTDGLPKHLLHEYTRTLSQKESSSVREISSKWDHRFPALREKLSTALNDTHPSHERTSRCVVGPCDTIQFEVVLDLHATSQFPSGTHLEGTVQLQICRPELANHSWRSVTSIVKPAELELGDDEPPFWNYQSSCELYGRGNTRDTIEVPFPAKSWANTFIRLAKHVTAERERERERKERGSASRSSQPRKEDGDEEKHKLSKMHSVADLLKQVAMYQEIWSAPNDGSEKPTWTRRSVVLWTFSNAHSKVDEKGKIVTVPPGTNWRFLTKIDPTSHFHQQRAYVSGSPRVLRDHIMSPNPGYAHHRNAAMHENSNSAYNVPNITVPSQQHANLAGLDLLDGFSNGLNTPPPSASLQSSYTHSLDGQTIASTDTLHHNLSFLSDHSAADTRGTMVAEHGDPFLAGLSVPVSTYEEPDCDANLQAWAGGATSSLQGLDPVPQWTTTYVDSQQSLAWADNTGVATNASDLPETSQWHDTSRDNTSWHDGRDSLWATSTASTAKPAHHDTWATTMATSQGWLQSVAAVADASSSGRGGWDDHHLGSSTSSSSSAPHQQYGHRHGHRSDHDQHGGTVMLQQQQQQQQQQYRGRKRVRADGGDGEDNDPEDREIHPSHVIRKLTHTSSTRRGYAPPAIMLENQDYGLQH